MKILRTLYALWRDRRATAAAEMVLVTPLLIIITFGAFELGNYFLCEHIVVKAVRDGARFASRRSFIDYAGCAATSGLISDIRTVTRTGQLDSGGTPRLGYWTDGTTITVSVSCDSSGTYQGIYTGLAMGVPVVTVTASVPYLSLFGNLGFTATGINLNATSKAAVMGT